MSVSHTRLFNMPEERIEVYSRDELISVMHVDYASQTVSVENFSDNWLDLPFGRKTDPDWADYLHLLSSRVFPPERGNCKELLKLLGVPTYDPDAICRKTHAVMNGDFVWFKYPGEKVTFNDVKMRD